MLWTMLLSLLQGLVKEMFIRSFRDYCSRVLPVGAGGSYVAVTTYLALRGGFRDLLHSFLIKLSFDAMQM